MDPTIQLIQWVVQAERAAEAERRTHVTYGDVPADEKPARLQKGDNRIERLLDLFRRQQRCECECECA